MNVLSTWVIHYTVGGGNAEVDKTQSLSMETHDSLRRPLNLDQSVIPEAVSRHSVTKLCRASPWACGAMRWPKPSAMPVFCLVSQRLHSRTWPGETLPPGFSQRLCHDPCHPRSWLCAHGSPEPGASPLKADRTFAASPGDWNRGGVQ